MRVWAIFFCFLQTAGLTACFENSSTSSAVDASVISVKELPLKSLKTARRSAFVAVSPKEAQAINDAMLQYTRSREASLLASASPRDQALATLIMAWDSPPGNEIPHGTILRKAVEDAPRDPLVQWIWATANAEDSGCIPRSPCRGRGKALAKLEPQNGAAWLPAVAEAVHFSDEAKIDDALSQLAKATRYDEMYQESLAAMTQALRRYKTTAPYVLSPDGSMGDAKLFSDVHALSMSRRRMYSFYAKLLQSCQRDRLVGVAIKRIDNCTKAGHLMLGYATTINARIFGAKLLQIMGKATAHDLELAREVEWLRYAHPELQDDADPLKRRERIDLYQTNASEITAVQDLFRRRHVPLNPKSEWQPIRTDMSEFVSSKSNMKPLENPPWLQDFGPGDKP